MRSLISKILQLKNNPRIRYSVACALLALATLSAWQVISYWRSISAAEEEFAAIAREFHRQKAEASAPTESGSDLTPQADPQPESDPAMLASIQALHEENQDLAGWVLIEGTKIDYPVMHTPDRPQYYIQRNFKKAKSSSGTPFMDEYCNIDSDNIILWGHNMRSGTMFAGILRYQEESYREKHPLVKFFTPYEERTYQVVAAFYSDVDTRKEDFPWYTYIDLREQEDREAFFAHLRKTSLIEVPEDIGQGDKFLTLATCSYHITTGRFVVIAQRIS